MENQDTNSQNKQGGFITNEQINALQILIQTANVAQKRGALGLEEAEIVSQAVKQFVVKENKENAQSTENTTNVNSNDTSQEGVPKVI